MQAGQFGIDRQSLLVNGNRFSKPAAFMQGRTQSIMQACVAGIEFQAVLIGGLGLIQVALRLINQAELEVQVRQGGIQRKRLERGCKSLLRFL